MAVSFANIFMANFETTLIQQRKQEQLHRESKVLIRNVFVLQCAAVAPVGHRTNPSTSNGEY